MEKTPMEGSSCVGVDKDILRVREEGEKEDGKLTIVPDQRLQS